MLVTAESCTGGGLAYAITAIPGSSHWFERGFVTYSNISKEELLGVKPEILEEYGSVSEEAAIEMAKGALLHSHAQFSIAITGVAGPEGGTPNKPVGTIYFAWGSLEKIYSQRHFFKGNRYMIRKQAIAFALAKCHQLLPLFLPEGNNKPL
ncbi:MAG: CinA family protein [Gammaproteobacteria bacterium]